MEAKKLSRLTVEEYLSIEEADQKKYEYHDGHIYAMAGGTLNHGLICGNIHGELRNGLRGMKDNCRAMTSEIKVHVQSENSFVYPDAMVICGDILTSEQNKNAVINPLIVVEVLSKSTSSYDRGDKFYLYRQIESLQEYILIEQEKALVEIYRRESGLWKITRIKGLENSITLPSIDLQISMGAIYQDVNFP